MNRRNFLRSMLGVAAATALPSEVWPFRKIFLPTAGIYNWFGTEILHPSIAAQTSMNALNEGAIEALELEFYKKEIPDLIFRESSLYNLLKAKTIQAVIGSQYNWQGLARTPFRLPLQPTGFMATEERILRDTTKELNDNLHTIASLRKI